MSARTLPGLLCAVSSALLACAPVALAQRIDRLEATYSTGHLHGQAQWETPYRRGVEPSSRTIARMAPSELRLAIPQAYYSPPRPVNIYVSLPLTAVGMIAPGSLELAWQTGGRFISGRVRPGQRALLFQGVVDGPTLLDQMTFTVRVDAADMLDRLEVEPVYEIEAR
jgi:hypothetical protein